MNPEAEEKLKRIVKKEIPALTPDEIGFLKARSSYLTRDEREKYEEVLKPGKVVKEKEENKEPEISLKDLKVRGEAVGIIYKVGTKKTDYQKLVEEAEKAK